MVRAAFIVALCALTVACSSGTPEYRGSISLEPTVAPDPTPTAIRSLPPSPLQPPPNTDRVPALILEEIDRLYPDYAIDSIILTDGPTMVLYCRAAGYVQTDENGLVKRVIRGDEGWLSAPVYQAKLPGPSFDAERVELLDFLPAVSSGELLPSMSFDVHVDGSGNLVSGPAICRRID